MNAEFRIPFLLKKKGAYRLCQIIIMNVRIVTIYLRLPPLLKRWRRVSFPVRNAAVKIPKGCLMGLVLAAAAEGVAPVSTATRLE